MVHRDLKPENLLLLDDSEDAPLKVIDFGTSRRFDPESPMKKFTGTIYYIAPEVLNNKYNEKCDVWSCGVILYILLSGRPPFNGHKDSEIYKRIQKQRVNFDNPEWTHVSRQCKQFIMKLLNKNPLYRPSAEEAFQSRWVQERSNFQQVDNFIARNSLKAIRGFYTEHKL